MKDKPREYAYPNVMDTADENTLLIVSHPDMQQVQQAAASGNVEAQQQLALVEEALALHRKSDH